MFHEFCHWLSVAVVELIQKTVSEFCYWFHITEPGNWKTSSTSLILTYILSHTISELLRHVGQIITFDRGLPVTPGLGESLHSEL